MAPKDMETDGSPEQIGLATVYLWREVSGPRWRDSDLAYLLAEKNNCLDECVDANGVVSASRVRRVAWALGRDHRYLLHDEPPPVTRPAHSGFSGGPVGTRPRTVLARKSPRVNADAPEHAPRPRRDTGGGRIPSDYVSPT